MLSLWLISPAVNANELQIIISGKAIHLGDNGKEMNESNYGLGLQYDINTHRRWIPMVNFASFKDSNSNTSKYIGGGIKRRFKLSTGQQRPSLDLGVIGFTMTRPGYNNDDPFIGVLPFVSLNNEWGGVNATYIPSIEDGALPLWYFQFSIKLMQI